MPLETGSVISDLNKTNPLDTDQVLQGDDHIRLIKSVLLNQFQGDGNGLNAPVLANATEMNFLQGVTSNIQEQFDALNLKVEFPAGTVMVFHQAAAPLNWTQKTTDVDNKMMRVVSTSGGGGAGTTLVSDWDDHTHAGGSYTLLEADLPAHTHLLLAGGEAIEVNNAAGSPGNSLGGFDGTANALNAQTSAATGGDTAHSHGDSVSSSFDPAYLDVIIATKD